MSSAFEENLSSKGSLGMIEPIIIHEREYDNMKTNAKVSIDHGKHDEEELGDSCCFGIRTVEAGVDCIWKLHGGV